MALSRKDLPWGHNEDNIWHMPLQRPYNNIRLSILAGFVKAIGEQNAGKRLQFLYRYGKRHEGKLEGLILHLSELRRIRLDTTEEYVSSHIACSLLLGGPETTASDGTRRLNLERYMTCDITTSNGRRCDDIFIFLTEVFPFLL